MSANRIPSLDGIRSLAFGLVFFAHSGLEHLIPGGFGVTIFFVLSGFLITTLLRTEFERSGAISFRNFYWRRALRILPPLYLTLPLTVLLHWLVSQPAEQTWTAVLSLAGFIGNYYTALTDYAGVPEGAGVTWSLAIEEHYYLLYPPLALWLLKRGDPRSSLRILAAIGGLILAWRLVLWYGFDASFLYLYSATESRADALLYGSLLALVYNPWLDPPPAATPMRDRLWLLASLALLLFSFLWRDEVFRSTFRYSLQALALLPLFWLAIARSDWWLMRWLNHPWLIEIGGLSYTLYLVHHAIIETIARVLPNLPVAAMLLLAFPPSWLWAKLMQRLVEQPLARLRKH